MPYVGVVTAIIGLILGIMGKKKALDAGAPSGIATAGIVMSIIGLAIAVMTVVLCIACIATFGAYDAMYWY